MSTLNTTNLKNPSSGSNNIVLNTDGTTTIAAPSNIIKSGTAVASTSGVAIDFTGLPSWVKRVTVMFVEVSTNGTSGVVIRLGTSAGIEATGYVSTNAYITGANACGTSTSSVGFVALGAAANVSRSGCLFVVKVSGNLWAASGTFNDDGNGHSGFTQGAKLLSATLDRIRITTVNGTDTFDAGSINILYEG